MLLRGLAPCREYSAVLRQFGPIDAALALGAVGLVFLYTGWLGWFHATRDLALFDTLWLALAELAGVLLVVALILRLRRQSPATAGFSRTHLTRSLVVGLALAATGYLACRLIGLLDGEVAPFHPRWITYALPYYLLGIGLTEEVLFRGLLAPRLAAMFRRRWIGVALAGLVFALSHVPFRVGLAGGDLGAVLPDLVWLLPITFGWHLVLWWLYARYNSLAAPTLVHLVINTGSLVM